MLYVGIRKHFFPFSRPPRCVISPAREGHTEYFIAKIRIFLRVIVIRRGPRATGASGAGAAKSIIHPNWPGKSPNYPEQIQA